MRRDSRKQESLKYAILRGLSALDQNDRTFFSMLLRSLWRGRNDYLWEGKEMTAYGIITMARYTLADWKAARVVSGNNESLREKASELYLWKKPGKFRVL